MPLKKNDKHRTRVPTGTSDHISTSESKDEMNQVQTRLQDQLVISEEFDSSSEESGIEEKAEEKEKNTFLPPIVIFTDSIPPPPISTL
jgi:hypothetical protein